MEMDFRTCLPEDVEKVVPLIYSSGPSSFDYVFKTSTITSHDFLAYAFQREGGEFSFDNHSAILVNKTLIGVGAMFSSARAKKFMFKDFLNIVRFYKFGALAVLIRGLRIEQILKPPTKNEIYLGHLGISKDERSKGYGQQLIQFLMNEIETNSATYFVLDVSEENPDAQRLYERLGFKVHKHFLGKYKSKYGYVPNFFRMHFK